MAKLTAGKRNALPKSSFGEPGKRAYPMPDKSHAANAKARASQAVNAGRMGKSTEAGIDAKANRVLHDGKTKPVKTDRGTFHMKENKPAPGVQRGKSVKAF
jgi:hypothetical protein